MQLPLYKKFTLCTSKKEHCTIKSKLQTSNKIKIYILNTKHKIHKTKEWNYKKLYTMYMYMHCCSSFEEKNDTFHITDIKHTKKAKMLQQKYTLSGNLIH